MPSGDGNVLTIHTNDGVERFRIDSSGNVKVGSAATISPDGDVFFTGVCTATTLTGAASGLTGALPAIDGSALTGMASTENVRTGILDVAGISTFRNTMNVGAAVTISESGIEASGIGITVANINGTQIGGRRNLIINGSMQVAQRATTYTGADNYNTVDRFKIIHTGLNEDVTTAQADVASGTTPYTLGFRKSLKITNGNQSAGADAGDFINIQTKLEAQDIANSGWNYTSSSSFITLSFWVKASVAQNYYGFIKTSDGSAQTIALETGALSADTWTKVTKVIQGDSNLSFDNDNNEGIQINFGPFWGTSRSDNSVSLTAWRTYGSGYRTKDATTTWYTTNDATFEITGVQLEVGSQATSFEHRSFGEELALCQRYFEITEGGFQGPVYSTDSDIKVSIPFRVTKRASPTLATITTDENCCSSVSVETNSQDATLGARVVGNNVFNDGSDRFFVAKFSADSEL